MPVRIPTSCQREDTASLFSAGYCCFPRESPRDREIKATNGRCKGIVPQKTDAPAEKIRSPLRIRPFSSQIPREPVILEDPVFAGGLKAASIPQSDVIKSIPINLFRYLIRPASRISLACHTTIIIQETQWKIKILLHSLIKFFVGCMEQRSEVRVFRFRDRELLQLFYCLGMRCIPRQNRESSKVGSQLLYIV